MEIGSKMHTQLSNSAHQARAILGAWHSGDARRLDIELKRVGSLRAMDSADEERLELLEEIAREMRTGAAPTTDPVYGSLLEHLAFPASNRRPARIQ